MISPEEAASRLLELRQPDRYERCVQRVERLPEPLRTAAAAFLPLDPKLPNASQTLAMAEARLAATRTLEGCAREERLRACEALLPGLGAPVERGWELHARLPYQIGWQRRAFRAAGDAAAVRQARSSWLFYVVDTLHGYDVNLPWVAAWAPYVTGYAADALGTLLAAGIEGGGPEGEEVLEVLMASARGEHAIGAMGRHVSGALLTAARPEGWDFLEKLLLAAQRQEGLRQAILEKIDEAHPEAFRRMLRLILDHDLLRFSAAIRAADVWFGFQFDVMGAGAVRSVLARVLAYLEDSAARAAARESTDAESVYLALWCAAFEDAPAAVPVAAARLSDAKPELRYVAVHLLQQLGLPAAQQALLPALDDADLRVALTAAAAVLPGQYAGSATAALRGTDLFERVERLLRRLPAKKQELAPLVWPWAKVTADRQSVASGLVPCQEERPAGRLLPYLSQMDPYARGRAVELLASRRDQDPEVRRALFALAGDASEWVRERAFKALADCRIEEPEAAGLERLLTRKAGELRRGVLSLLLGQPDAGALASADRLLAARDPLQRLAGLELLSELRAGNRSAAACRERAERYRAARPDLPDVEQERLRNLLGETEAAPPTLDDALGLMDPAQRTPVREPKAVRGLLLETPASTALVQSLEALLNQHRETPVRFRNPAGGEEKELLGNVRWGFPRPQPDLPLQEDAARLPLREVWEGWWEARPADLRDRDGRELLRALGGIQVLKARGPAWRSNGITGVLLLWLIRLHPPAGAVDFLLDAAETQLAQVPADVRAQVPPADQPWSRGWRTMLAHTGWLTVAREHRRLHPSDWGPAQVARLWQLTRWLDEPCAPSARPLLPFLRPKEPEPAPALPRFRPPLPEALAAWEAGAATEADVLDLLLGSRGGERGVYSGHCGFPELQMTSARRLPAELDRYSGLRELVDRCRRRVLEVELRRGDLPTAATGPALVLRSAGGMDVLVRLLQALGPAPFVRGWIYNDRTRAAVFSKLIRATYPGEGDTPERFVAAVRETRLPEKRLVETAVYAPQWAEHVEAALGWPQFAEAVWWLHAHTKDSQWSVEHEIRETWTAQVSVRTPLTGQELIDGAVDVAWFHRVHAALGEARWAVLDEAAKYSSGGGGHKRAQLFASAMLGRASRETLLDPVREKRAQDSLRALGLLPLPEGPEREAEVLERYRVIQEFLRGTTQFGAQRQASEKLAAGIAMENLARTAGFPDPVRLEWAMEARASADLAEGPLTATAGDVTVTLSLNPWGEPVLACEKNGKPLKALSPAAKKLPEIAALVERRKEVERQASRMRLSLERAMCRGDRFTGAELHALMAHPVLAPMLRNLVFLGEGAAGYPVAGSAGLERHDGTHAPLGDGELRLAHPHDLLQSGEWHLWQQDCFRRERIQPFKQVFRELYVLTAAEREAGTHSDRYAGHQVQTAQAMALLGRRGWVGHRDEGSFGRTFHEAGLTAWLEMDSGWSTPAEVEGLAVHGVHFTRRGDWKRVPLEEVPPRVFSEAMRDVDLVVSVAHAGGVDPEATGSTVEMRAALLRETCRLLRIENVRFQGTHVLVDGTLGTYSVHLGSAVVHRQPGGHVCIVAVPGQHRGRVFLPFADDDPRTAEVIAKVLLLARDQEIRDPTILEQILPGR